MTARAFLSIRTGPWSISLAAHVLGFAALMFLGRDRVVDLTLLDLGAPPAASSAAAAAAAKPADDVWRLPDVRRRIVAVPKPAATPEPEPAPVVAEGTGTFGSGGPYRNVAQVSQLPRFSTQVKAAYPEDAKRANVEGLVVLQVEIDDTGKVQAVSVVQGLGYGCDEAAAAAVSQSTFTPATVGTEAVPVRIRIPYRFKFE
jgi:protein TonB